MEREQCRFQYFFITAVQQIIFVFVPSIESRSAHMRFFQYLRDSYFINRDVNHQTIEGIKQSLLTVLILMVDILNHLHTFPVLSA